MWSGNFKSAVASLRLYRWRSFLTMTGVIIGICSVVTFISLGQGLKSQVVGQINNLGSDVLTVRSGRLAQNSSFGLNNLSLLAFLSTTTLTNKDVDAISSLSTVRAVAPLDFLTSTVAGIKSRLDNVFVMGTTPALQSLLRQKVQFGRFLSDQDNAGVVIGSNIALKLFKERSAVGENITIAGHTFIVRGVLQDTPGGLLSIAETDYNSAVYIPFSAARAISGGQTNIIQILAASKDSRDLNPAINDIHAALLVTHSGQEDFTILRQEQLLGLLSGVVNTITSFISGIAAISLLVGGVGIMDIMLVSISERTREIGIRKAIGATNGQILQQFVTEGLVLTLGGGLIGVILSLMINLILRLYTSLHPVISVQLVLLAVIVSVLVGVIFSVIPALKAARKDPIVALRGE